VIERKPRHPIHAVLFDLDATLVDSEDNYYLADVEVLRRRGIAFSQEDKKKYIGGGNLDMMIDLVRRFGLSDTPQALGEEKNAVYLELALRDTPLYPQMKRFWDLVRGHGLPVAVASGSSPAVLRAVLEKVGLAADADAIVSAEEVARGKPAPDVFLEARRRPCSGSRRATARSSRTRAMASRPHAAQRCRASRSRTSPTSRCPTPSRAPTCCSRTGCRRSTPSARSRGSFRPEGRRRSGTVLARIALPEPGGRTRPSAPAPAGTGSRPRQPSRRAAGARSGAQRVSLEAHRWTSRG
jgi:hypothetical protein